MTSVPEAEEPLQCSMASEDYSFVHDLGDARSSRFRFKKRSRKEDDDNAESEHKRRKHRHGHRRRHHHHRSREESPKEDPTEPAHGMDTETAFRESLFDAMADDEGAAYWEGVYGQPIHKYPNTRPPNPDDPDGELEQMSDEEYTAFVRARMWEKTHQHVLEERRLREEAAKKRKESETRTEQMEAEKEEFDRRMEESLRKGTQRKKDRDWREAWAQYVRKWEQLLAHTKGRTGDEDIEDRDKDVASRIPWPVQSGTAKDVSKENVEAFFKHAARREGTENGLRLLLKTERVRWHPDRMSFSLRGQIDPTSLQQVTSVFQIVDAMYNSAKSEMHDADGVPVPCCNLRKGSDKTFIRPVPRFSLQATAVPDPNGREDCENESLLGTSRLQPSCPLCRIRANSIFFNYAPRLAMVQIQPQSVGLRIPKKRKRTSPDGHEGDQQDVASAPEPQIWPEPHRTTVTTVPVLEENGGQKARRTTRTKRPELTRHASSTFVETDIPWPEHFTRLSQAFRALNLTYTFCCTRKSFATTFENIKSTVESHLRRSFSIEDIAQMRVLVSEAITFKYVSESLLQVNLMGAEQGHRYRRIGDEIPLASVGREDGEDQQVLLFEFNDGDLKRQVQSKQTGEATKATTKLRHEELKMPVYSQKQMLGLIEKRNKKFTSSINNFLNDCATAEIDPVISILDQSVDWIPAEDQEKKEKQIKDKSAPLPPSIPKDRKSIPEIISELKTLSNYSGQIVPDGHRVFDPQEPIYGELKFELSQSLVNALYNTRGIERLFAHQAEAINNLHDGHSVIVATSTSSGKSLIYQIPVLHELEQNPHARAMYIFPTKALAQDQRRSLKDIMQYMPGMEDMVVETFDGDTDKQDRQYIRDEGRIIFTNPDMLHVTILPQEESWRTFLQNLKYVVVDELHVYNGLFGSHVAFIMRRLRRICASVGNRHVKFISCSATVANPEEHMKTIFGVDAVKLTDFDGSPSGRKEFVCWNTPYKDPGDPSSGRGDTMMESAKLICQLVLRGVRVIAFTRIRKTCELLLNCVKSEMNNLERPHEMARVMAYRGGYTPQDRRVIEREMFEGKLMGIIATNALELGIDIGSLDAVITVGFPYTIANLRQQSGRAGRRNRDSLSVLVGDCFPTDQYFMDNPDEIFTRPNCELQVDLQNMLVVEGHVQCAAYEMPIRPDEDSAFFGKQLLEIAEERMDKDRLGFYHCSARYRPQPSKFVAIRDTEDQHFAVVNTTNGANEVLEDLEASRAFFTVYEGGIFLHQGNTYLVKTFSQDRMVAEVVKVKVDWVTQQRDYTDIDPIEVEAVRRIPDTKTRAFYGAIKCIQVVYGFFKLDKRRRILDAVEVDNPPIVIFSKGMWIDVPKQAIEILKSHRLNLAAGIHGAEHAILSLMPNYVISMPGDVKTECKISEKELSKKETSRKRPARLTFYDAKGGAGGSGISTKAFEFVDLLLRQACERVLKCQCTEGCLECCASERCKDANRIMSKVGSEVILKSLLNMEIDVDALPWGEEDVPEGIETVVIAEEIRPKRGKVVEVVEIKREDGSVRRVQVDRLEGEKDSQPQDNDVIVVKEEPKD